MSDTIQIDVGERIYITYDTATLDPPDIALEASIDGDTWVDVEVVDGVPRVLVAHQDCEEDPVTGQVVVPRRTVSSIAIRGIDTPEVIIDRLMVYAQ